MDLKSQILSLRHQLGSDKGLEELRKILEKEEDSSKVIKLCTSVSMLSSTDGPLILRMCLLGSQGQRARIKILQNTLEVLMTDASLPNAAASDVASVIQLHLDATVFDSPDLVKLIKQCVSKLDATDDAASSLYHRWLGILSRMFSLVVEKEYVIVNEDDDEEISGKDYRQRVIRSLCSYRWSTSLSVGLVTMFRDSGLTSDEMDIVLEKVCDCVKRMTHNELPPLVHQTLLLCRSSNECLRIFVALACLYNKKFQQMKDNVESEDMIDTHQNEDTTVIESAVTVIFHLTHAIKMGHPVGKEIVKLLKSASLLPEVMFSHFTMLMSLSLGSQKQFQPAIMECIKVSSQRCIGLRMKRDEIAWLRTLSGSPPNIIEAFQSIIMQTSKHGGWDLVGQGIVDAAFTYLDSSPPAIGSPDEKLFEIWELGSRLLRDVLKFQPDTLQILFKELTKRIIFSRAAVRYTDALHGMVRERSSLIMEHPSILHETLEQLGSLGVAGARRILAAVMPMIKSTRSLRDITILILRKALFNPQVEPRKIGVTGVLLLLQQFRMTGSIPVSQMLSQSQSSLSQAAVDVHRGVKMSSEALCLEILGVLRRCFSQPTGVKLTLYQGLYDVVIKNPPLCGAILDMLHHHIILTEINNPNAVCPINIDDMVYEQNLEPYVQEPVGWFLHACQLVVSKAREIYDGDTEKDDEAPSLDKMVDLLDDLARKYSELDISDVGLEKNSEFSKLTISGQVNCLKVETLKNIYEALMELVIMLGIDVSQDKAQLLIKLFTKHAELSDLLKPSSSGTKTKKAEKGKKVADKKVDDPKINPKPVKPKTTFAPPPHAFSLRALAVVTRVILTDQNPAHQLAVGLLRESRDFQHYILRVTKEKLEQVSKSLSITGEDMRNDIVLNHVTSIAKHCYENALVSEESDPEVLSAVVECLISAVKLVKVHFKDKLGDFNQTISRQSGSFAVPALVEKTMMKVSSVIESEDMNEEEQKRSSLKLISLLTVWLKQLSNQTSDQQITKFCNKFQDWTRRLLSKTQTSAEVLISCVELALLAETRYRHHPSLFIDLGGKLHEIVGGDDSTVNKTVLQGFDFVSESNGDQIFSAVASSIENWIEVTDLVIGRLKPLLACRDLADAQLSEWESGVCHNIGRIVNSLSPLAMITFKETHSFDQIYKLVGKVYTSMATLTKYFFIRSKTAKEAIQVSKFDTLVSRLGKMLTFRVYQLLVSEKENKEETDKTKKRFEANQSKKEARTIPILIYKLEAFEKDLIRLDNRCKLGLAQNLRPSSARDFRLNLDDIRQQSVAEEAKSGSGESDGDEEDEDGEDGNPHAAESTRLESQSSNVSGGANIDAASQESVIEAGLFPPASKKLKVKMKFGKH